MLPETRLRLLEESDLNFLKELRGDSEIIEALGTFTLLNDARQKRWFDSLLTDTSKNYLIFEVVQENSWKKAGMARITEIDLTNRSACVGADIHAAYRGQGLAMPLYKKIFELCFEYYNLHRLWLLVLEKNQRARHLYARLGFIEEGRQREAILRHGEFHDYIMMSFLPHPQKPKPKPGE